MAHPSSSSSQWKVPSFDVKPSSGAAEVEVVFVAQDAGKKAIPPKGPYGSAVEKFRKGKAFVARSGQMQLVRFGGKDDAESVLFVGIGPAAEFTAEKARVAGGLAFLKLQAERFSHIALLVDSLVEVKGLKSDVEEMSQNFLEGFVLVSYKIPKRYKKAAKDADDDYFGPSKVTAVTDDKSLRKSLDNSAHAFEILGESVSLTRDWSNDPSNYGTPEHYAAEAQKLAKQYGLKCKVLTEADAKREGMGLFLSVGQGSDREGRIVIVEYTPKNKNKNTKTIAFVGKGVTFDSGGISIKPSLRMEEMKHDMTGAATMMGATLLAARMGGCPNRIVTIMAFTENMPGGDATQPGNVITGRNGKTVEIINTDAEGRLILADVLDYAHEFKPDAIIDAATLTGAVQVALGKQCCGILGNDETLIDAVRRAGDSVGERMWQLPLWDEYFEDLKSDYADMKNSANDGAGGTIRGGIFLKQFIRKGTAWAHLDIAATAWGISHLAYMPKRGASGLYVRSLAKFAFDF
jgi:leucyl aminopeptidase